MANRSPVDVVDFIMVMPNKNNTMSSGRIQIWGYSTSGKVVFPAFSRRNGVMLSLFSVLMMAIGCDNSAQDRISRIEQRKTVSKERKDALKDAFSYLPQLIRLNRTAALKEIRQQLNTWAGSVEDPKEWKSSELLFSISPALRSIDFAQRLDKLEFGEPECEYLLQCQILSNVSKWVLDLPYRDPLFAKWLESKKGQLEQENFQRLETTLKLFDWTIANVGLIGSPKDVEQLVTNPVSASSDQAPAFRQLPWQTLMFASGDRWERARLFTQLLFAQGIDSCVLALPSLSGATEDSALRLWCVGVPIQGEIYLFEPQWGLPIPSQENSGVATLREARTNANVLRRGKVPGLFEYPVEQKDLEQLVALVDSDPFAVGKTMATVQRSLVGANRIRLSTDVDAFQEVLQASAENLQVKLWNAPWLSYVYNKSVRERLNENSPFSARYMERYGALVTDTPISRARMLHFKGKFDSSIEEVGALRSYMDYRVDEQTLREMMVSKDVQKDLGLVRGEFEPLEVYNARLGVAQTYFRRSKFDVGMYLAMANMDLGKPKTAINWLTERTLQIKGSEYWHSHAYYLLGRMYEQVEDYVAAEEAYKFEASAQAAGNRIRLRKLRQEFANAFEGAQ